VYESAPISVTTEMALEQTGYSLPRMSRDQRVAHKDPLYLKTTHNHGLSRHRQSLLTKGTDDFTSHQKNRIGLANRKPNLWAPVKQGLSRSPADWRRRDPIGPILSIPTVLGLGDPRFYRAVWSDCWSCFKFQSEGPMRGVEAFHMTIYMQTVLPTFLL